MIFVNPDSEDAAIEQPTIALFGELDWETRNLLNERVSLDPDLGRTSHEDVVLVNRLRAALEKLNPGVAPLAIEQAIDEITSDRGRMSLARANQAVYKLLKDGVPVRFSRPGDEENIEETIQVIDWKNPEKNDFLLCSQFWVAGDYGRKRADLVGFVNGLPLVLIELKASHRRLELAYSKNLSDYKNTIPQLFWYNALIILSNGSKSRLGSMTAGWEHFCEWKKMNSEGEEGVVSLETMIRGVCDRRRLIDLVENFVLFSETKGGTAKLVAKNHQFLGVNNAIAAVHKIRENQGKLGVFWHTQGSGKSFSMVFFSQKVLRTVEGNWTFVIVTDRDDLDGQIYRNFASTGAVLEEEKRVRASSGENLKQMLEQEDHRYVFTLIQKFRTERGEKYPVLSERSDIIVITDEAHRSQYDIYAHNMRQALPNAAFIGFTGTPLVVGEERTKQVFGDYVSIYNFKDSVEDHNTVPLYYENRIPELQIVNDEMEDELARIVEEADLDEDQQRKLEKECPREYQLLTREDRLDRIGQDIAAHYMGRGTLAKAMVVSIDKATAIRTYDKVQKHWKTELDKLRAELERADPAERPELEQRLRFFEQTDMAVIVSSSQNEIEEMKKKGADIAPHRKRMVKEDLETKFKDDDDPLRIVFVCAMWITGFDVPSCSTIYLDKPMKNHTLMQTIARANRVWRDKQNGLIVDYVGVFRNLQKALAIYGAARAGGGEDSPIESKAELAHLVRESLERATTFCQEQGVDLAAIRDARGFDRERLKEDAVAALVRTDDVRRRFMAHVGHARKLYQSLLPDDRAREFAEAAHVVKILAEKIQAELPPVDISAVMEEIEALLNRSIAAEGYVMPAVGDTSRYIDLTQVDFEALRAEFEKGRKPIEAQRLRGSVEERLGRMLAVNPTRKNLLEEFERMIEEYNAGSVNVEAFFAKLMAFAQKLNDEEKRGIAENLSEEELAIFDLLTKPDVKLTPVEEREVKKVAKTLLETLKHEKLTLDWRKQQSTRASVRHTIQVVLDHELPRAYSKQLYEQKCDAVWQHVFEAYAGYGRGARL